MYITRIAPSPTGLFHLGTARTAYINYLAAKSSGGKFILRVDDTDIVRNKQEYTDIILNSLEWLDLVPDETFYQSKRIRLYQSEAQDLVSKGKALTLDNGAIALKCPFDLPKQFTDTITGNIPITQTNRDQIDRKLILIRGYDENNPDKEGTPTYQFSSVIDDYFMGINWIIRGVDHITNTPKQIAIWVSLNNIYANVNNPKDLPKFSHMGLITYKGPEDTKARKLSKRDGAASLLWYKEQGYKPEAVLDWMLHLGWSKNVARGEEQDNPTKPLGKQAAIELFNRGKLSNKPCNYDINKLNTLNKAWGSYNE